MKTSANIHAGLFLLLFASLHSNAQDLRTFNQNASRSNHYSGIAGSGLNLTFSPLFSTALNKNDDSLLFRGNGGGFRIAGDYFFGKAGIGFSSGFGSSAADDNSINRFLQRMNIAPDQVTVTKSSQQNMYLLLGPSVRFGSNVQLLLQAKGGLFVNNSGLVMIQQKGAIRAAYMNGSTGKSIYPGFQTGFNIQYSTKSDVWSFGVSADYMGTQTEVNNYDARRNGGIEALKLSRTISDLVAGINVRYNIAALKNKQNYSVSQRVLPTVNKRDIAIDEPGMLTQRVLPTVNKKEIAIDEPGMLTQRVLPTVNKKEIAIDESGVHRIMEQSSCGPVTMKTTNPDGSVSESTFACPNDAAVYNQLTSGKQTQGKTFGEKVQQGLQQAGIIHRDLAARNILIGKVSFVSGNVAGIETNETISSTQRKRPGRVKYNNINLRLYAREAGSGMATGRRQYQPVFSDDDTDTCNSCIASVVSNPVYHEKGGLGENPMYENDKRSINTDDDCDGVSGLTVLLADATTGAVLATTKTEACGEFFFANLPSGPYAISISGTIISKKGYDVYLKNKADIAGKLSNTDDHWTVELNTGTGTAEQAAAVIKTKTKSNQSNDRIVNTETDNSGIIWSPRSNLKVLPIAIGDVDGDGVAETIVGNNIPGEQELAKGIPLKGVGVSLGKIPGGGGSNKTAQTNDYGEFQFTNLEAGNYNIIMEHTLVLDDKTLVWVGDDESANNIVTSESGLTSGKGDLKDSNNSNNNPTLKAQNNNTVRSNRTDNAILNTDNNNNNDANNNMRAQNNNTVRSNRTDNAIIMNNDNNNNENNIAIDEGGLSKPKGKSTNKETGPVKWMAPESMKVALNTSEDNLKSMGATLDELDQQVNADNSNSQTAINNAHSNIKNLKVAISDAQQTIDNLQQKDKEAALKELNQKMAGVNMKFTALQTTLSSMGQQYTSVSNVLKTKHDTVKNSIQNIR
jgi:hypothetical protein